MPSFLHWLRHLKNNPIYRRERGEWGQPNFLYTNLTRYSPLIMLGVAVIGLCSGISYATIWQDQASEELFLLYCLVCLPNIGLQILSLYGVVMAPALTAPMISQEQALGSWEILLLTPQSRRSVVGAKLLGALARMRIWLPLLILAVIRTFPLFFLILTTGFRPFWLFLLLPAMMIKPFADIIFAALFGLFLSTQISSGTTTLALSYAGIFVFSLFNSSLLWGGIMSQLPNIGSNNFYAGTIITASFSLIAVLGLAFLLAFRADKWLGEA